MTADTGTALFLPAWNEADNLPLVVGEAVEFLLQRGERFTVIVVDDGSTDRTPEVARGLRSLHGDCVKLVRHPRNLGYGAALRTGFRAALKTGHEWIAFCDADGQFRPSDVGALIDSAAAVGADIAVGYRTKRADSLVRRVLGYAWQGLSRLVLRCGVRDVDCGFKAFRRSALLTLERQLAGDHASISPEILSLARRAGYKIVEVGVSHYPRRRGTQSGGKPRVVLASLKELVVLRLALRRGALR